METCTDDRVAADRHRAVAETVAAVRAIIAAAGMTPHSLERIKDQLVALARRGQLFPDAHFPEPATGHPDALYGLSVESDQSNALYVYRPRPGHETPPHNHTTWAVVAGIEGCEPNLLYRRLDDRTRTGHAILAVDRRVDIGPGDGIWLLPNDIHSIHIAGSKPIKHLHMYGRSLLDLPQRLDFDLAAGTYHVQSRKPTVLIPVGG